MRTIELAKGIHSSVLGFGCAPILGSVDGKKARRALDIALESGINHFDIARSYGYGEAEAFVGKVMQGRRDTVVLASKFGIKANWKAKLLAPIKPIVRSLRKQAKESPAKVEPVASGTVAVADRFHDRIPLQGKDMRISLERSLKALRTDHLDYFFVHEPLNSLAHIEDLVETAAQLKSEGKIRAWGLAYMRAQEHLHTQYIDRFDVLQFDNSPGAPGYDTTKSKRGLRPNIIFSPLRGGSRELTPAEKFKTLFTAFPQSVILCSMFNEKHIHDNILIAREGA